MYLYITIMYLFKKVNDRGGGDYSYTVCIFIYHYLFTVS